MQSKEWKKDLLIAVTLGGIIVVLMQIVCPQILRDTIDVVIKGDAFTFLFGE